MDYSLLIGLHALAKDDDTDDTSDTIDTSDQFIFYKDFDGGFQSSFEDNTNGPEVYYLGTWCKQWRYHFILYLLGIIDILTPYSLAKKLEHTFKSLVYPKDSISAVNPSDYARRFLKFMSSNILRDVGADYGKRALPAVPGTEECEDEDGFSTVKACCD